MKLGFIKILAVNALILYSSFISAQIAYMVKDLSQITESSNPTYLTSNDSLTYFVADDGIHGTELWVTKGNKESTKLLYDIYNGETGGVNISFNQKPPFTLIDSILFFVANDIYQGDEIWRTNGTKKGTYRVKWSLKNITLLKRFKSELLFISERNLWLSSNNITEFNIIKRNITNGSHLIIIGDSLYFIGWDETHGNELWCSDGTTENTKIVKDIYTGYGSSFEVGPMNPKFVALNNILYFICMTPEYGREIWRSDGTEEGTYILKDINPGVENGFERYNVSYYYNPFCLCNKKIYFAANDGQHGGELWATDGTAEGTYMVKDIFTNGSSNPYGFIEFNNKLFFKIHYQNSLWLTDGNSEQTIQLIQEDHFDDVGKTKKTLNYLYFTRKYDYSELWRMDKDYNCYKIGDISRIKTFETNNYSLFFSYDDSIIGYELCNINDSENNFKIIEDINKVGNSQVSELTVLNNSILFTGKTNSFKTKLWITNGTEKFTKSITGFEYFPDNPRNLVEFNNMIYFIDNLNSYHNGLFKTDGTKSNTLLVKDIDNDIDSLQIMNNYLYINCYNELWRSGGEPENTSQIINTLSIFNDNYFAYKKGLLITDSYNLYYLDTVSNSFKILGTFDHISSDFFYFNDKLFFYAEKINMNTFPETYYNGFWVTDGTVDGTYLSLSFKNLDDFIIYKNHFIISGMINDNNFGIFKSDGTNEGTFNIENLSNETAKDFIIFKDTLYYTKSDYYYPDKELYKTTTEINASILLKDIFAYGNDNISNLYATDSLLFFSADNGINGIEPWQTKGTEKSTKMISDINKTGSSNPTDFTLMNGNLYFIANDGMFGRELWTIIYKRVFKLQPINVRVMGKVYNNQYIKQLDYINIPDTGHIAFNIISGNYEKAFKIDGKGILKISNEQYLNQFDQNWYSLEVVMSNGIKKDTAKITIHTSLYNFYNPQTISIPETNNEIVVYPNPCLDELNIKSENELIYKIELISLKGNVVYSKSENTGSLESSIIINDKKTGIYFCRLFLKDKLIYKKIIIR